jgi:ketosteroid isomerase-like protein
MKKIAFLFAAYLLIVSVTAFSQSKDETEIRRILDRQVAEWNKGDIDEFMKGYWQNDSLMFIGKSGVTYGYINTLNNYKKGYADTVQMGKLKFDILHVKRISKDAYFVVGKWHLKRTIGDIGGHYTLLWRKINGNWVIVADHSS